MSVEINPKPKYAKLDAPATLKLSVLMEFHQEGDPKPAKVKMGMDKIRDMEFC